MHKALGEKYAKLTLLVQDPEGNKEEIAQLGQETAQIEGELTRLLKARDVYALAHGLIGNIMLAGFGLSDEQRTEVFSMLVAMTTPNYADRMTAEKALAKLNSLGL